MATSHTSTGTPATGETTAESLLAAAETALASNSGVKEVEIDDQRVVYDRSGLDNERNALQREVAREAGKRPAVSQLNLTKAWA